MKCNCGQSNDVDYVVFEQSNSDRHTDGHGYIDTAVNADEEYKYFMGSEAIPFPCYIHSH